MEKNEIRKSGRFIPCIRIKQDCPVYVVLLKHGLDNMP